MIGRVNAVGRQNKTAAADRKVNRAPLETRNKVAKKSKDALNASQKFTDKTDPQQRSGLITKIGPNTINTK